MELDLLLATERAAEDWLRLGVVAMAGHDLPAAAQALRRALSLRREPVAEALAGLLQDRRGWRADPESAPELARLAALMGLAHRQGQRLISTVTRLFPLPPDDLWSDAWADEGHEPGLCERVDAFVERFARLQGILADELAPALLVALLERPSTAQDNLKRLERLGLLPSFADWIEAHQLRTYLVQASLADAQDLSETLERARRQVPLLIETYNRILRFSRNQFGAPPSFWPSCLEDLGDGRAQMPLSP